MDDQNTHSDGETVDLVSHDQAANTQSVDPSTSPAQDNSGYDDNAEVSNSAPVEENGTPDKSEAERREEGKLQQTQRELEELRQQQTQVAQRNQTFEQFLISDPEIYKNALIQTSQWTPEQAEQKVAELKSEGFWQDKQVQSQGQPQGDSYDMARAAARAELENQQAYEELFKVAPDFDLEKVKSLPQAEQQQKVEQGNKIIALTNFLVERDGLSKREAIIKAYKIESGKTDDQVVQARQDGRIEGFAQANFNNATSTVSTVGTQTGRSISLSADEKQQADALGMTPEEFKKFDDNPITSVG